MLTNAVKKLEKNNQIVAPAAKLGRVQTAEQKEVPDDKIQETAVQRVDRMQF